MEVVHRCRTFSVIANLNKLESFILHNPAAQCLYQQYLSSTFPGGGKANHIPFFKDITSLGAQGNCSKGNATFRAELYLVFEKYIVADSGLLLDIPHDRLDQVRRNIQKDLTLSAFKPAIKVVVRELAFIHMDSFFNSAIFSDFRESVLAEVDFNALPSTSLQEKDSTNKLRKFFGDKFLHTGSSTKLLGDQPKHIKEFKLSKMFGERVGVEKIALLEELEEEAEEHMVGQMKRRDRRLHIFFGDNFEVEETLFAARVMAPQVEPSNKEFHKQPEHVNTYRLAKFFGERPPPSIDLFVENEESGSDSDDGRASPTGEYALRMHSKAQHLMRFFGERMDLEKEATSVSFAAQPEHVKACTLKKIFGESAAHTINFDVENGGTWPKIKREKSRAKLAKFFGPYEG